MTPVPTVVTDFAWATTQMQAGSKVKRAGWTGKYVFLSGGQELMQLPATWGLPSIAVPWLWAPGDTTATDWEIVT